MFDFIKNAFAEITHVVWPTRKESIKYMTYTIGTIIIVGIFLAILGYAIREVMTLTRNQFPHAPVTNMTVSGEDLLRRQTSKHSKILQTHKRVKVGLVHLVQQ